MKRLVPLWAALVALCGGHGCVGEQQQQCSATGSCDFNMEDSQDSSSTRSSCGDDVAVGEVPVIDISALMDPDSRSKSDWDEASEAVSRACEQWGFFQVRTGCFCVSCVPCKVSAVTFIA